MEVSANVTDLRQLVVFDFLAVIVQAFVLFELSWNIVAIIVFIVFDILLLIVGLMDWFFFSRKIILDADGCSFVSFKTTKKFLWEQIYLQHTENSSFLFGDSEFPGEGVILSTRPISKPKCIGAMTYCRYAHPRASVFIRFTSPFDEPKRTLGKFVYRGFVADKEEALNFFNQNTVRGRFYCVEEN